ncbi:MBOAT family protein [Mobilitalea sibirica]|uniref:MBOAT family protein n=1 Tax=Mobilitalea sibirica TaxID=1462919 RepID=A0A8J7H507_9FIRM|nr:MBOAT family protein [Mobilitalea sibirica]MBH1939811.1 MBOAT family protein [Mobilitalea sibirica]
MLFTSYRFIFLLIILFITYYLIPKKYQWILLLIVSYLFYSLAGIKSLVYIMATTVSTYIISWKLNVLQTRQTDYLKQHKQELSREERKSYKAMMKGKQRKWLVLCLLFNFGILAVLKYTNFTFDNINSVLDLLNTDRKLPVLGLVLPLGISFYTFQTMGYIIDVYREKYSYEKNIFRLALFVSFFPQLVQGPISRFDDLKETLFEKHPYIAENISFGLQRILWGFFKKLVVADRMLIAVNTIVRNPDEFQGIYVVLGIFFYAITLYADFTGGIDIAIGIAQVLGIRLKENFERPYFSKSTTEYWRRWHITLGTWFKDYMFYPISVSKSMLNLSKKCRAKFGDEVGKRIPVYIASIVVWFTTGIWHGAAWNFIVWGLLNCLVILVSQELTPLYTKFHERFHVGHTFWYRLFQVGRTFWLMGLIRILDCYRDVGTTFRMYGTIITKMNIGELFNGGFMKLGLMLSDYMVLMVSVILLLIVSLLQRKGSVRRQLARKPLMIRYATYFIIFLAILIFGAYGVGYDSGQFIYSQF